jgi:hypothetical protein
MVDNKRRWPAEESSNVAKLIPESLKSNTISRINDQSKQPVALT